jgi:hypothetical protein
VAYRSRKVRSRRPPALTPSGENQAAQVLLGFGGDLRRQPTADGDTHEGDRGADAFKQVEVQVGDIVQCADVGGTGGAGPSRVRRCDDLEVLGQAGEQGSGEEKTVLSM